MNKTETIQVITLLAGNYDSIAKKDKIQKQLMINTWQECLGDLDFEVVLQAVERTMMTSVYPPTIAEVRKNAIEMINPSTQRSGIEAWDEAYRMICNGGYMTQEQFESHSPEVKKFFGSVNQLKAYATNADFNMDVVRSNFLKQYDVLIAREKEQKLIPSSMQEFAQKLAQKMNINQIGK